MKFTAILLSLLVCFHGAYAQDNFMFPPIPAGPGGGVFFTGPMLCGLYVSEDEDDRLGAATFPHPFPSVCAIYNSSGQIRGYLGGYGKWCVIITEATQSKAAMFAACAFTCDDMNLNNTNLELPISLEQRNLELPISLEQRNLELPMSLEQRLPDEADIGVTLDIIDEWMVELLETGEEGPVFEQAMQLYDAFWLLSLEQRLTDLSPDGQLAILHEATVELLEAGDNLLVVDQLMQLYDAVWLLSLEQRLTDLSPDGQLAILHEGIEELLETGGNELVIDQLMQLYDTFMLSVHACRLHECEDVAQCQRVADMAFEEILEFGIELDIDQNDAIVDAFDNLEDARELARLLGSPP